MLPWGNVIQTQLERSLGDNLCHHQNWTFPQGCCKFAYLAGLECSVLQKFNVPLVTKNFIFSLRLVLSAIWNYKTWNQSHRFVSRRKIYKNSNDRFLYLSFYVPLMKLKKPSFADVLKSFAELTGKHMCQSLFFNKVAGLRLLRTLFFIKQRWWLLLKLYLVYDWHIFHQLKLTI